MAVYNLYLLLLCLVMANLATVKHTYNVLIKSTQLNKRHEKFYSEKTDFEIHKYNETTDSINAVMDLLQDLPRDVLIDIQSYELVNNNWQKSTVHINDTWCNFLVNDTYIMGGILKRSNYPKECPITANKFKVDNFMIDVEPLPVQVPGEHWRFVFQQSFKNEVLLEFSVDVQIQREYQLT